MKRVTLCPASDKPMSKLRVKNGNSGSAMRMLTPEKKAPTASSAKMKLGDEKRTVGAVEGTWRDSSDDEIPGLANFMPNS